MFCSHTAVESANRTLAPTQALSCQPECPASLVFRLFGAATQDLAARLVIVRCQTQPGSKVLDRGPGTYIGANLSDDGVDGQGIDAINGRQVYAYDLIQ